MSCLFKKSIDISLIYTNVPIYWFPITYGHFDKKQITIQQVHYFIYNAFYKNKSMDETRVPAESIFTLAHHKR